VDVIAMTPKRKWNYDELHAKKYHCETEFPLRLKLVRWVGRQTWLPKGQGRLLRALLHPDTCPHFLFEIDFFSQKYRGDLAEYIDRVVFCYGAWSLPELRILEEMASRLRARRPGPINFVDVGANTGHHTLFMARIADQVLAIEPFPPLQSLINERILINGLMNVRVAPVALGEKNEILNYYPDESNNIRNGTFLPNFEESSAQPGKLQVKKGDDYFDEVEFGRIDLMKVDVEGFEPFVFRGLQNRIMKDRPIILTEMSAESRSGFGSENVFRGTFYKGAQFATVTGHQGRTFRLRPFVYETSDEVLILPPEMGDFIKTHCG
jgi:FkbM family methyltransferase